MASENVKETYDNFFAAIASMAGLPLLKVRIYLNVKGNLCVTVTCVDQAELDRFIAQWGKGNAGNNKPLTLQGLTGSYSTTYYSIKAVESELM